MRAVKHITPTTWAVLFVLAVAVAGVTHVTTLLVLPYRSPDDAFARVSALTVAAPRVMLPPPGAAGDSLPFRDPAMLTAVCRFDLRAAAFHVTTSPFAESFVTIGFHSRHGVVFYGLTVQASDGSSLDLALNTGPDDRTAGTEPRDQHQVAVAAPEPEGFVTLSTPLGGGSELDEAEERLKHFGCGPQAPAS